MSTDRKTPRNPLVLDDDYEKLYEEDFLEIERIEEGDREYDYLLHGGRRKKPVDYSDF